jgi:hypothetical protein
MSEATTTEQRGKVRQLQERIARFEDIQRRTLRQSPGDSHFASTAASSLHTAVAVSTPAGDDAGRYDSVGKLARVVSKRPNAPRYALVNSAGEVVSFVSPAAGVNLPAYEGQYVGVTGQRGYMPELKKPHVTALRVTELSVAQSRTSTRR